MKPFLVILGSTICLAIILLAIAGLSTRFNTQIRTSFRAQPSERDPVSTGTLTLMIWNIGYAGLGRESDFLADGGKMVLPPSKSVVEKNLAGIQKTLRSNRADIYLFQEIAGPGLLTRGVDVRSGLLAALPDASAFMSADAMTRFTPAPFGLRHGPATFSYVSNNPAEIVRLPNEPAPMMGLIPRLYHVQVTRFEIGAESWVVINAHLSAFDEGANTRQQQLDAVLALAKTYYEAGKHVVVGGDWNMRLTETDFTSTSAEEALFWIHDFPKNKLEAGWSLAYDAEIPSVRTNERPYVRDENYRTVIDGLLLSPNVRLVKAEGIDLDFEFTDHQPVVFSLASVGTP